MIWSLIYKTIPRLWRFNLVFSSRNFIFLDITFRSMIHFQLIFVYSVRKRFNFFIWRGNSRHPRTVCCKDYYFPYWIAFASFSKTLLTINTWVYFWGCNSLPLLYMSIFTSIPHRPYCHNLIVSLEMKTFKPSSFALLFQDCFGYSGSLKFLYEICPFLQNTQLTYAPNLRWS